MAGPALTVDDCVRNRLAQDLFGDFQLVLPAGTLNGGYPHEALRCGRNGVLYDLSELPFAHRSV